MKATAFTGEGEVQKFGFRRFVEKAARRYYIAGYAKNLSDGTVRVLLQDEKRYTETRKERTRAEDRLSEKVNQYIKMQSN